MTFDLHQDLSLENIQRGEVLTKKLPGTCGSGIELFVSLLLLLLLLQLRKKKRIGVVLWRMLLVTFLLSFLYHALLGIDILLSMSQEFRKTSRKLLGERSRNYFHAIPSSRLT